MLRATVGQRLFFALSLLNERGLARGLQALRRTHGLLLAVGLGVSCFSRATRRAPAGGQGRGRPTTLEAGLGVSYHAMCAAAGALPLAFEQMRAAGHALIKAALGLTATSIRALVDAQLAPLLRTTQGGAPASRSVREAVDRLQAEYEASAGATTAGCGGPLARAGNILVSWVAVWAWLGLDLGDLSLDRRRPALTRKEGGDPVPRRQGAQGELEACLDAAVTQAAVVWLVTRGRAAAARPAPRAASLWAALTGCFFPSTAFTPGGAWRAESQPGLPLARVGRDARRAEAAASRASTALAEAEVAERAAREAPGGAAADTLAAAAAAAQATARARATAATARARATRSQAVAAVLKRGGMRRGLRLVEVMRLGGVVTHFADEFLGGARAAATPGAAAAREVAWHWQVAAEAAVATREARDAGWQVAIAAAKAAVARAPGLAANTTVLQEAQVAAAQVTQARQHASLTSEEAGRAVGRARLATWQECALCGHCVADGAVAMTRWHAVWVCPSFAEARRTWARDTIEVLAPWPEGPAPSAEAPEAPRGAWAAAQTGRREAAGLFNTPTGPFEGAVRTIWTEPAAAGAGEGPLGPDAARPHPLVPTEPCRVLNGDVLMALGMGGGPQFRTRGAAGPFFPVLEGHGGTAARRLLELAFAAFLEGMIEPLRGAQAAAAHAGNVALRELRSLQGAGGELAALAADLGAAVDAHEEADSDDEAAAGGEGPEEDAGGGPEEEGLEEGGAEEEEEAEEAAAEAAAGGEGEAAEAIAAGGWAPAAGAAARARPGRMLVGPDEGDGGAGGEAAHHEAAEAGAEEAEALLSWGAAGSGAAEGAGDDGTGEWGADAVAARLPGGGWDP